MHTRSFQTSPERQVRRVLDLAVNGTHYWVNSQTPVEMVVVTDGDEPDDVKRMIRNGTFDFTIHSERTSVPVWAIEKDDPTHDAPDRVLNDIVKNRICGTVGLPLLRVGYREDDDFLSAIERRAPLEWLVRRWIAYEEKIPEYIRSSESLVAELTPEQRAEVTFEEMSPEFHFDSDHLYPPLRLIVERLLERYAVHVDLPALDNRPAVSGVRWRAGSPWLGPLPNLNVGGFLAAYDCEIEVRPAGGSADVVFAARGAYTARIAYPVKPGQRSPFDLEPPYTPESGAVVCSPPWGGSPARIGGEVALYRALKQVEHWAKKTV